MSDYLNTVQHLIKAGHCNEGHSRCTSPRKSTCKLQWVRYPWPLTKYQQLYCAEFPTLHALYIFREFPKIIQINYKQKVSIHHVPVKHKAKAKPTIISTITHTHQAPETHKKGQPLRSCPNTYLFFFINVSFVFILQAVSKMVLVITAWASDL